MISADMAIFSNPFSHMQLDHIEKKKERKEKEKSPKAHACCRKQKDKREEREGGREECGSRGVPGGVGWRSWELLLCRLCSGTLA